MEHLLGPLKFLLLSMPSVGILPKVAAQAKKHTFVGALDYQIDLVGKSQPSKSSNCVEQKLLTGKLLTVKEDIMEIVWYYHEVSRSLPSLNGSAN